MDYRDNRPTSARKGVPSARRKGVPVQRLFTDEVLAGLSERFEGLYARTGRPSIAPEMLLRATLLQAFFSVRSDRLLMEQIDYRPPPKWRFPRLRKTDSAKLMSPLRGRLFSLMFCRDWDRGGSNCQ